MSKKLVVTTGGTELVGQVPVADGVGGFAWGAPGGFGTVVSTQQAGNYTFALADVGTVVESTSATAVSFTVPPNASVACPIGALLEFFQFGAGQITIVAGAGVTIRTESGKVRTAAQYATGGLRQRATDDWVLSGDLA